ncbi:uncharacterized protein J4E84_008408 [Alternaria hordeiaustralica]|uniref:uncharacterized protein n=1 Tax=Alternaria hordeiaustralica TaxID=1187925 RepID=UPI0020C1C7BC|nr:uncharacterized protein J4E84_008408 [Alternaria hordeiaustralica]KAI4679378.1 hypothetical protein J4E84_008408 [Alternaria hordeiaustralica]
MEDSPLSIAANIAGLLTFAVAILASIYVRIASLRNGRLELEIIRESVEDNVQDLMRMSRENPSDLRKRYITEQGDEPDLRRLKNLSADLNATEIFIYISATRGEEALQRIVAQQSEVKAKLEELTRLLTTASQAPARPASDDISGIPVETCTTVSPGQTEGIERHVDAEGSELETTDCFE